MPSIPTLTIYGLIFASAFLVMQLVIGVGRHGARRVKLTNIRMQIMAKKDDQQAVLRALRTSRGINEDGQFIKLLNWLSKLVVQSGLRIGAYGVYIAMSALSFIFAVGAYLFTFSILFFAAGFIIGLALPVLVLMFFAKRRRAKAVKQLADALDVIVRSLRAGHPVPVAIDLVAREMPDPIGSEFGMAVDEITYGTAFGKAIQRLADRVGHTDFDMFAATIRLQEKTGGNLTELLSNIAHMVRERQRMRLKIKAASSEGRMSALILNVVPILLFTAVNFLAPDFYGDVKDVPFVRKGMIGAVIWMGIGNLVIRKMINFKI
jgi:tight adherence protein B